MGKHRPANYRKCEITVEDGTVLRNTLEELVVEALDKLGTVALVHKRISSGGLTIQDSLVTDENTGKLFSFNGHLCGVLVEHEKDKNVPLLGIENEQVKLDHGLPINAEGEKSNYAQNHLYFSVYKNHVAYVCSKPGADGRLEDFFRWLLADKSEITADKILVTLKNALNLRAVEDMLEKNVNKIILATGNNDIPENDKSFFNKLIGCVSRKNGVVQHASELKGVGVRFELTCRDRSDDEVKLSISELAKELSEEDLKFLTIWLKDDGAGNKIRIKGEELAIKYSIEVQSTDPEEIAQPLMFELSKWLTKLINLRSIA